MPGSASRDEGTSAARPTPALPDAPSPALVSSPAPSEAPSPALAPPPGNPRFPLFDGLRGIAVLAVLAFHSAEYSGRVGFGPLGRLAEVAGSEGVIVFFVISGFLLYRPFAAARADGRKRSSIGRYGRRRALRILPAYWAALTLLAIFPGIAGVFTGDWWRYYGYLQLYSTAGRSSGIQVGWTLCVEVSFYIVLPLWVILMRRLPDRGGFLRSEFAALAVLVLGGGAIQLAAGRGHLPYALGVSLAGQGAWLALGMALAVASVAVEREPGALAPVRRLAERPALLWAIALVAAAGLAALVPSHGLFGLIVTADVPQSIGRTVAKLLLQGLVALAFVFPAAFGGTSPGIPRKALAWRPFVALGVISYSFYLYHLPIVAFLATRHSTAFSATGLNLMAHVHTARTLVLYVLALAITTVVATISYRLIELPFLRRKERHRTRLADGPPDERAPTTARIIDAS
jgi:peptidoglycan/LPS O-acetylase OafA/YrhL